MDERTRAVKGENSRWQVKKFKAADLVGNVDIKAQIGSEEPRSEAYRQFIVGQELEKGLIDVTDPSNMLLVHEVYHTTDFVRGLRIDIKDALRERDDFLDGKPLRPREIDNHVIHDYFHTQFAKTEEFLDLPEEMQAFYLEHIYWHREQIMAAQQRQAIIEGGAQPGQSGQGAGQAGMEGQSTQEQLAP